ncbi:MAG: hypothetical protein D6682_05350 [Zetaproteobacteria bacterium]|nr:MAG: hypothetical protein D6682_05350 [Zetaproteobacteria bacterium]
MTALVVRSVSALAMVLALFAGLVWLLRRIQHRGGALSRGDAIRVRQRTVIGGRHALVEVEYGDERLLLGVSPERITPLARRGRPTSPPAAGDPPTKAGDAPS